jgi:phosphatidate cytidylyltransferase
MVRRIIVAVIGIPLAVGVVYAGGWVLVLAVAVLGVVGTWEFYRLAARRGVRPVAPGLVVAALIPAAVFGSYPEGGAIPVHWMPLAGAVWLMTSVTTAMVRRGPEDQPLAAVAVSVFSPLYAAGMPAFLIALRHGGAWPSRAAATTVVLLPLVTIWIADSLAMAGGALFGGPKLAPVLSPKKTWAGAVAHVLASVVVAPVIGIAALRPLGVHLTLAELIALGLAISLTGQVGDIGESLFKREAGVKDSGRFFSGHGGVLDRLDALYWVLPVTAGLLFAFRIL